MKGVRYRDRPRADPPDATLSRLPPRGIVVFAVVYQTAQNTERRIVLRLDHARRYPCCDGTYVAGGEYALTGAGPGLAYSVIVRVYFGSTPTRSMRAQAQRALRPPRTALASLSNRHLRQIRGGGWTAWDPADDSARVRVDLRRFARDTRRPTRLRTPPALGSRLSGDVVLPDDESWDAARQSWNLAVDQRPVAVVLPESVEDVVETVRFAGEHGLRIAFNAGGHNAGPIDWTRDALLLKMERMRGLEIDVAGRRARAEAGVLANAVAHAAGEHGLAYLAGTSPDVGIVGYTLGGGFNWLIRKHGLAVNSVLAVELVTADGRLVRADSEHESDLFWAVRGGGGNFGAVTAIEFALYPIEQVYAGAFFWPIDRAAEILNAWRAWVETVPLECESIGRLLQLPDAAVPARSPPRALVRARRGRVPRQRE